MGMRSSFDPNGIGATEVDKVLGTAYEVVRAVSEKLPAIQYLAENIDGLTEQSQGHRDEALDAATASAASSAAASTSAGLADADRLAAQEAAESAQENANLTEASRINAEDSETLAASWAGLVGAPVTPGLYSAKEWATGAETRGDVGGGSSRDWANYLGGPVDATEYSAKKYAQDSATSATASANTLVAITNLYYGNRAADPTTRPDGSAMQAGDRYFSTTSNYEKVYTGSAWQIPNVGASDLANQTDAAKGSALVGFLPPGTGAVGRTVQADLRDMSANVKRYGAKTGNNTVDALTNRQAFQAALNYLKSVGGGELFVPNGKYSMNVAVPIIVPSNVRIRGVRGASIICPDISTVVDVATRPFPLANGAVFVSGNPDTGEVSSIANGTGCIGIHFDGVEVEATYTRGALTAGQQLRGISIVDTIDATVNNCRIENLPNTGIYLLGCIDFHITNNRATRNGFGPPAATAATKNGISCSGRATYSASRLNESYMGVVTGNTSSYNQDEGIQYGFTCGVLIEDNVCIGNGHLGIEGDTSFSVSTVYADIGHEVPSQAVISGNYVDGRKEDGSLGKGGISFAGGNEGVARITGNTVRNVGGASGEAGIAASQVSGGIVLIENNILDKVDPGPSYHQIQSNMANSTVRGNKISRPGATNVHNSIYLYGNIAEAYVEDNRADTAPSRFLRVSADVASTFTHLVVHDNVSKGTADDAILFVTSFAQAIQLVSVRGNKLLGVNSSAATDKYVLSIKPSSSALSVTIALLVVRDNDVTYAGATRYAVGLNNIQAGFVAYADVQENNFGALTLPFGVRAIDPVASVTANGMVDRNNQIPGQRVLRGSAAPTTGSWNVGDRVEIITPVAGGTQGWVCTSTGSPGTWKTYGSIAA